MTIIRNNDIGNIYLREIHNSPAMDGAEGNLGPNMNPRCQCLRCQHALTLKTGDVKWPKKVLQERAHEVAPQESATQ